MKKEIVDEKTLRFLFLERQTIKKINNKHYLYVDFWDMVEFGDVFKEYLRRIDEPLDTKLLNCYMAIPVDSILEFYEIDIETLSIQID